ncbi:hypothetical protein SDC9_33944 [bioreactor metagenome]|uniref:DUF2085 domain-containing protein n=1 Tax=bioreactor metagenome TaxID=1076179 RepID=A0A644V9N0_9ZZZZ|nr:DUF2085 domain-containing protein [Methanobrevibacter sp.]MEA4957761.1 DUF2085 domain-containing protein [Methanobrevibacter sp.]
MNIFKYLCHQKPERSFKVKEYYLPVCSRCTGFYLSGFIYIILAFFIAFQYTLNTTILAIMLLIPFIIDGLTQFLNLRESNNTLRFFNGILGGIGLMILVKTIKYLFIY